MRRVFIAIGLAVLAAIAAGILLKGSDPRLFKRKGSDPFSVQGHKRAPAFEVRFDAPNPPRLNEPVPVTLLVQGNSVGWSPDMAGEGRLEILLRLPIGIKLNSPGWEPAELTPEEKNDSTGPWALFVREQPIRLPATVSQKQAVAQESISLIVVEEGLNWIISSRVRLSRGQEVWQSFGLILATLQGGEAQFHTVPKRSRL